MTRRKQEGNTILGLYKLFITRNPLFAIPDDAFFGLERTLWKLDLSNNELLNVPSKALRYLQKLRFLDLTGTLSLYKNKQTKHVFFLQAIKSLVSFWTAGKV